VESIVRARSRDSADFFRFKCVLYLEFGDKEDVEWFLLIVITEEEIKPGDDI